MQAPQPPQTGTSSKAIGRKVGDPDAGGPAHNDIADVSSPVDQEGQLSLCFPGQFHKGTGKFRGDDPLGRNPSMIKRQDLFDLRGLES